MSTETETIFQQPIGFLDLSQRAHYALTSKNIRTVGDLVAKTRHELVTTVHNFGKVTCDGVEEQLKRHKLHLAMTSSAMSEYLNKHDPGNTSLHLSIDVLRPSVLRSAQLNVLHANKIDTLGDLVQLTEIELSEFAEMGKTSIKRIKAYLNQRKMALKPAMPVVIPVESEIAIMHSVPKPMFSHNCTDCRLIGRVVEHDLYVCDQGGLQKDLTLVARYGPRPHETATGPTLLLFLADKPVLRIAIPKESTS